MKKEKGQATHGEKICKHQSEDYVNMKADVLVMKYGQKIWTCI